MTQNIYVAQEIVIEVKLDYSFQQNLFQFEQVFISHANLPLMAQTSTSAGSPASVETAVSAGTSRAVMSAAASWDTESRTEQNPSTPPETRPPAEVKLDQ